MVDRSTREEVRRFYEYRCAYCGVHEQELGSELEIDHFQPRAAGGGDGYDNLVYCCPTCNRLKGDFRPVDDPMSTVRRLLKPGRDDLGIHVREETDSLLTPLTETGAFHLERLRLNRPPLVALRRARQRTEQYRAELMTMREEQAQLRGRIATLEKQLQVVLDQLARILGR